MATKPVIRVFFKAFWAGFPVYDNIVTRALSLTREVVLVDNNPDVVFHKGHSAGKFPNATTISWIVESMNREGEPNYDNCDYSLNSCTFDDERNYRIPFWATQINWNNAPEHDLSRGPTYFINLDKLRHEVYEKQAVWSNANPSQKSWQSVDAGRGPTGFVDPDDLCQPTNSEPRKRKCCSVASNPMGRRLDFYPKISEAINVVHGGDFLRNTTDEDKMWEKPGNSDYLEKIKFISQFKSHLCFENDDREGYVCEKILHAFYAGCLPIYWGPKNVGEDFNKRAFIDIKDYPDDDAAIAHIKEVLNDESKLQQYLDEPIFPNNKIPRHATPEGLNDFFIKIGI